MANYLIRGGHALKGDISVSGSKNAALGVVAATMLLDAPCVVENVPEIADIKVLVDVCRSLGAEIEFENNVLKVDPTKINTHRVENENAKKIRAVYYLQGALLGRYGKAVTFLPGGCNFGTRPFDLHIKGFEALGAVYSRDNVRVYLEADKLVGTHIFFDRVSVGATINIMMAASKAEGTTVLENVAREPHVVEVANFLNNNGARIRGAGTDVIRIEGVQTLAGGPNYSIIPDQIEAGTYMIAGAATKGDVTVRNLIPKHMEPLTAKLDEMGAGIEVGEDWIRVYMDEDKELQATTFRTHPYPGYPTDLHPQTTVLLTQAKGVSHLYEMVWENRFQYVDDLRLMGAEITISGNCATVPGPVKLQGAQVLARDLRAGAAMVLAGMVAEGVTEVVNIHTLERGYERLVTKLTNIGADITIEGDLEEDES